MGWQIGNPTNVPSVDEGHRVLVRVTSARSTETLELRLRVWDTVKHVKRGCHLATSIPLRAQQLLFLGRELSNRKTLQALLDSQISCAPRRLGAEGMDKHCVLEMVLRILPKQASRFGSLLPLSRPKGGNAKKMVERILSGFNRQLVPKPTPEGLSGSYFLRDRFRNSVAIFKPRLEEPFAPQNPKGLDGRLDTSIHASNIMSGRLYLREAAAYLLDEGRLFGVPETFLAVVDHPFFGEKQKSPPSFPGFKIETSSQEKLGVNQDFHKTNVNLSSGKSRIGSVQRMVPNNGCISNISVSKISNYEVQKIAVLDMRILNADRNDGNILFRRRSSKQIELIPIDHGMSLGSKLSIKASEVVWTGFPQIRGPLDARLEEFILELEPEETVKRLSENLDLRPETLSMLAYAEYFLKICVKRGLRLDEMAQIYYRQGDEEVPSHLERLIESVEFLSLKISKTRRMEWYTRNRIFDRSARLSGQSLDLLISRMKESPEQVESVGRKDTTSTRAELADDEIRRGADERNTGLISNIPNLYEIGLKNNDLRGGIEVCSDFFSPRTFLSKGSPLPGRERGLDREVLDFSLDSTLQKSRNSQSTKNEDPILILDGSPDLALSNPNETNSNVRFPVFNHFEKGSSGQINEFEKIDKPVMSIPQICRAFVDSGDLVSGQMEGPVRVRRRLYSEQKTEPKDLAQAGLKSAVLNQSLRKSTFFTPRKSSIEFKTPIVNHFEFGCEPFCTPEKTPKQSVDSDESVGETKRIRMSKIKLPFRSAEKEALGFRGGLKRSLSMCEFFEELNDFRGSSKADGRIPSAEEFGEIRSQVKTREARDLESLQRKRLKMHYFCSSLEQFLDAWLRKRPLARAKRKYTAPVGIGGL